MFGHIYARTVIGRSYPAAYLCGVMLFFGVEAVCCVMRSLVFRSYS